MPQCRLTTYYLPLFFSRFGTKNHVFSTHWLILLGFFDVIGEFGFAIENAIPLENGIVLVALNP
jgi:hypothetical protein